MTDHRADDLEVSDPVNLPAQQVIAPVSKESAVLVAAGTGVGAAIAGVPGALAGGAIGWAADMIRRRLMRR